MTLINENVDWNVKKDARKQVKIQCFTEVLAAAKSVGIRGTLAWLNLKSRNYYLCQEVNIVYWDVHTAKG